MKRFVKMCKTMYFSEYKSVSFLFRFCMERANSVMGRNYFFVCQQSSSRMMEILSGAYLCITQCMDEERRCAEFVRELVDLMPQSHCRMRTNWQFKFVRVIIPGHSSNDNDNQFEQCSSRPYSFGRSVWKFWTCSKSLCIQQCPARILFIRGYAHWKRVVIFFVAQLKCCILVILTVFVVVLTVY